jgi:hypothetical protein
LKSVKTEDKDEEIGIKILDEVLSEPLKQNATNAGKVGAVNSFFVQCEEGI